jgi:lipopolysaccharide transport system permease protein
MSSFIDAIVGPFQSIWKHRLILWRTTLLEVRNMYAGSLLGSLWVVLGQILMLCIYALTYVVILRIRPTDMSVYEYILYVFCGLTSFIPFSSALTGGTLSLVSNRSVLLSTIFPAELIPFRSVLVASVTMPVGTAILLLSDAALSQFSWTGLLVPLVMILQIMFVTGLVWILSLAALLFRDIQHLIYYGIMMLMVITPIAYTPTMIPSGLKLIIYLNPLSYFVISFQYLIILNTLPSIDILLAMVLLSFASFTLGYLMVRRAKGAFYDYA